jgi:hypothetical protein
MSTLADRTATAEARRYADAITQARAQLVYAIGTATGPVIDDAEVLLREAERAQHEGSRWLLRQVEGRLLAQARALETRGAA